MQTFLPYPDFKRSAACLDYRRLGKQRVEAKQLLNALALRRSGAISGRGWVNHPATLMWEGYEDALRMYMNIMIDEWVSRGYNNTMQRAPHAPNPSMPPFVGNEAFHASHRSNLLRKDAGYYGQFRWSEPHDLEYVWGG